MLSNSSRVTRILIAGSSLWTPLNAISFNPSTLLNRLVMNSAQVPSAEFSLSSATYSSLPISRYG